MKKASVDKTLLFAVIALIIIGIIAVYSSTSVLAFIKSKYASKGGLTYLQKHLFTLFLGSILMIVFIYFPKEKLKYLAIPLLIISFILLVLVFSPMGVSAGGARRWIKLWPSVFQPSEVVKLAMVFFLAWFLSRPDYRKDKIVYFLIPVGLMGIFQVIFLKQPDFGAAISLGIITFIILLIAGISLKFITITSLLALPIVFYLIKEPYRWKRITSFIDPWADPQGSGFQLVQSLIALGSGGLTGKGLGEGKQKLAYLPEIHTDFIFAHIGEEMGFLGACTVVILFIILSIRGFKIAEKQRDLFYYLLASGITIMISVQALINFAVVTGLAPTKGLPLPFISYGGSSLIVNMMAVGVLLNISKISSQTLVDTLQLKEKQIRRPYIYYRGRKFS